MADPVDARAATIGKFRRKFLEHKEMETRVKKRTSF